MNEQADYSNSRSPFKIMFKVDQSVYDLKKCLLPFIRHPFIIDKQLN